MKSSASAVFLVLVGLAIGAMATCPKPQSMVKSCVCAYLYKKPNCRNPKQSLAIPFNSQMSKVNKKWLNFSTVVVAKGCRLYTFSKAKYKGEMKIFKKGVCRVKGRKNGRRSKVSSLCCVCPKF